MKYIIEENATVTYFHTVEANSNMEMIFTLKFLQRKNGNKKQAV